MPKLVDDWRTCHRWISMNCMVVSAAIQGCWIAMPEDLRSRSPDGLVNGITIGLMILGVCGRLLKQGKCNDLDSHGAKQGKRDLGDAGESLADNDRCNRPRRPNGTRGMAGPKVVLAKSAKSRKRRPY